MPAYDYRCRDCGARLEATHPMTDPGPSTCPACGGTLHRLPSVPAVAFKGSGFYTTDSRPKTTR